MELNKTEDNKCCFLHFGRGVQDPLSGDQGGSLDPWTPPPLDPPQTPEQQASMWNNYFQRLLNEHSDEQVHYDNDWQREIDERIQIITATSRLEKSPDDINMNPFTC